MGGLLCIDPYIPFQRDLVPGGGLSLQRLWLLLQPSLRTLAVLDALCTKVRHIHAYADTWSLHIAHMHA